MRLLVVAGIFLGTAAAWAGIPEPDVVYYGTAKYGTDDAAAGQAITLVLDATSAQLAAYTMGAHADYVNGNSMYYVLKVPMDALAPIEGQAASFYVDGSLAGRAQISAKGSVVALDLDTLEYNDSDSDGLDDTWEMQQFGTLQLGPQDDINGDGIDNLEHQAGKTDPTKPVWTTDDLNDMRETCVFHPLVLRKALTQAQSDRYHNRINLQAATYIGNFSYEATWGENYDLEIVGGYDAGCEAAGAGLTVLDGGADGGGAGGGTVLTLDTAAGPTSGNIRVQNLYITGGSAAEGGGLGVVTETGDVTLVDNIITGNTATEVGGGISLRAQGAAQTLLIANNTIDANEGGGIYCTSAVTPPVIMNNIITNNLSAEGVRAEGTAPVSDYNNFWNNDGGAYNDPDFQGDHDIFVDPLFANEDGGDLSLQSASACVDAGRNDDRLPGLDIQGNDRIMDGDGNNTFRVDLGAYEMAGTIPTCVPFTDEDCDTVADALDQCPGFDDNNDEDGDGVPNGCDRCPGIPDEADADGDGMPDCWEALHPDPVSGSQDLSPDEDPDGDDFSNLREYLAGTDPTDPDSHPINQVPGVPVPTSPSNQSEVTTSHPVLVVENATDDDLTPPIYEFQVFAAQDMTTPVAVSGDVPEGAGATTWQVAAALSDDTVYRWRVRAKDDAQKTSAWSNFFTFFVNTEPDAPTALTLNSPQDGAEVDTLAPELTVNNATDPDQDVLIYIFEIDKVDTLDSADLQQSPGIQEGAAGTTSWTPAPLDDNTRYYWRAGACDPDQNCAWMSTANFFLNLVNEPPSVPDISAPPDGALVTTFQPVLEVSNATDPDGDPLTYEFELYADEAMNAPITSRTGIVEDWDGTTAWRVDETLQNNWTYFWRAQASDDEGLASGWSELFTFTISTTNAAPSAPAILTPQDGSAVQTLEPALVIYNATDPNLDAISYYFDIDKVNTFNSTALQRSDRLPEGVGDMTAWRPPLPLTDRTTYYWRVIAYDGASYSPWTTGSFVVDLANDPPTAPAILTPQDGAELQTLEPTLVVYNATDPNPDAITYYFDIDQVPTFNSTALQRSGRLPEGVEDITAWRPSALNDHTTYHWRVAAYDGASYSEWATGSFFINLANDPPGTPTIQSPGEGDEVAALSPVLQVNDAVDVDGDALTYDYEVYADPDGTQLVRSIAGAGTSWQVDAGLDDNTDYWWRFRARDEEGMVSGWSTLFTFFVNTVNDAPSAPSINRPQYGREVATRLPVLEVNNAADVDGDTLTYEFEIDEVGTFSSEALQFDAVAQSAANTTSWSPWELVDHTTYYWRARACDADSCSEWMPTAEFFVNIMNESPVLPNLSAPPDGSEVTTELPTLEVTNATNPDGDVLTYEFEVYDDKDRLIAHKTGVLEEADGTTAWRVNERLRNHRTYWWRVQARDSEGEASGWSDLFAFEVNTRNEAPSVPAIVSPPDGGEVQNLGPVLEVTNALDADREPLTYWFEIDKVNTFDSLSLQQSDELPEGAGLTTAWSPSELKDNTTYYWRTRAFDGEAYGDWGTGSFFVNRYNDPPDPPTIQNPDEGAVLTVSPPVLSVYPQTDPDLDDLTYDYAVYADADRTELVGAVAGAETSWQMETDLVDQVPYYWWARAVDAHGLAGDWSLLTAFTMDTRNPRPTAPTLNNPFNRGIVTTLTPTLSVNNSVDPDDAPLTYEFELYADPSLTDLVSSARLSEGNLITAWTVDTQLTDKTTYYWRARANDGKLPGSWMNTAIFMVDTEGPETRVVLACAQEVAAAEPDTQKVAVTRRGSPLEGVALEIPPGALRENCTITIGLVENPPALPENTKAIGKVLDFGPDGTLFDMPITVRIPYTWQDLKNSGVSDPALLEVWTFNPVTLAWEAVPVDRVEGWYLVYQVRHFSMFTTGKSVLSAAPEDAAAGGGGGGAGCFVAAAADTPVMDAAGSLLDTWRRISATGAAGISWLLFIFACVPILFWIHMRLHRQQQPKIQ